MPQKRVQRRYPRVSRNHLSEMHECMLEFLFIQLGFSFRLGYALSKPSFEVRKLFQLTLVTSSAFSGSLRLVSVLKLHSHRHRLTMIAVASKFARLLATSPLLSSTPGYAHSTVSAMYTVVPSLSDPPFFLEPPYPLGAISPRVHQLTGPTITTHPRL
eukprot:748233-Hanusia_phi.AAC.1